MTKIKKTVLGVLALLSISTATVFAGSTSGNYSLLNSNIYGLLKQSSATYAYASTEITTVKAGSSPGNKAYAYIEACAGSYTVKDSNDAYSPNSGQGSYISVQAGSPSVTEFHSTHSTLYDSGSGSLLLRATI